MLALVVALALALELETDYLVQCPHHCSNIYNLTPKGIQFSVSTTSKEIEITLALVLALASARDRASTSARDSTSASARDSTSASAREIGKIAKFLNPHHLRVHKVQNIFLPASKV